MKMKTKLKKMHYYLLLNFFVISSLFLFGNFAFAQEANPDNFAPGVKRVAGTPTSTIGLSEIIIVNQNKNEFKLAFALNGGSGAQPQVKYGVSLIKSDGTKEWAVDSKTYDKIDSITENAVKKVELSYSAPVGLSGTYYIRIEARNLSGFIFANGQTGEIKLDDQSGNIFIDANSCNVIVDGDKNTYSLAQGVDIKLEEKISVKCQISNSLQSDVEAIPSFETHVRNLYGNLMGTDEKGIPLTITKGTKEYTFEIPKGKEPQSYDSILTISTKDGHISNNIVAHYVLKGQSATIQNVVFDKDSYKKGDNATVNFSWTGAADNFIGSRSEWTKMGALDVFFDVIDGQGRMCAQQTQSKLPSAVILQKLSVTMTQDCINPVANFTIKDSTGKILAQQKYAIESKKSTENTAAGVNKNNSKVLLSIIALLVLLAAILLVIFFVRRNISKKDINSLKSILFMLIFGSSFMFAGSSKADVTFSGPASGYPGYESFLARIGNSGSGSSLVSKTSYTPGEEIKVYSFINQIGCANCHWAAIAGHMWATINSSTQDIWNGEWYCALYGNGKTATGFSAPTTPGNYNAVFSVADLQLVPGTPDTYSGTGTMCRDPYSGDLCGWTCDTYGDNCKPGCDGTASRDPDSGQWLCSPAVVPGIPDSYTSIVSTYNIPYTVTAPACAVSSWSPDPANTCSTSTLTQTSNCGTTRSVSGTKCCAGTWSPDVSSVCSGSSFTQSNGCTTQTATGTATGGAYSPDPSTVCSGTSFIQSNSCGVQNATGTKACSCTPSTWTPAVSTVCSGSSFTQSNGCTTQTATGTATGGAYSPDPSTICSGTSFPQTNACFAQTGIGTKVCCTPTTWTPATSSVCAGTNVTQTSNCGSTRTATGTKYCPGADWKEVPVN
jgi:hypothetical protein